MAKAATAATAAAATTEANFDDDLFEARLVALKDTQEGIQQMSTWCLQQRAHHKKIIQCWLNVFKRVRVEHRLVLFYLANDVIQYSKRKRYEFVECWATALQRATTMVRDERVKGKILRIFNIWEQREIYNEEFLSDLSGLLNISPPKKSNAPTDASDDFQPATLVAHIRECVQLADLTDKSFAKLPKMPDCDIEVIKQQLKDKSHSCDIEKEFERSVAYTDAYKKNLNNEIKSRKSVIEDLELAMKFFTTQRGEVKVVATAYKNFSTRVKMVNKKVEELVENLTSPMPSPDVNAPSPEREADLRLPDEQSPISMNMFKNNINGYSSYMDGKLPFDINDFKRETGNVSSQPIEVIGTRSDDESYSATDYYKPESLSGYSDTSNIIPGLSALPVSAVQSEYSSLARSAQQYNALLPPPAPPIYGNLSSNEYVPPHLSTYNADQYTPRSLNTGTVPSGIMPPPPPLPPNINNSQANTGDDRFSATWDMNMSWTPHDSSSAANASPYSRQSTPHSPPHFERKGSGAPIEYSEHHHNDLNAMGTQDIDHRQMQLPPAFEFGAKLGLNKDQTRQLVDIDHRNLISLTGSPRGDKDFHTNTSGDVDYRKPQAPGKGNETQIPGHNASPAHLMAPPNSSLMKKSPLKSNASSSSESAKDDSTTSRYDPTDMVIDMDMSDEDLDEILKEVNEGELDENGAQTDGSVIGADLSLAIVDDGIRSSLLDTPTEYIPQNVDWDTSNTMPPTYVPSGGNLEMDMQQLQSPQQQQQQPQQHPPWNQMPNTVPWNGNGSVPPPPRPPFAMPFQQFPPLGIGSPDNMRGRGRGGGGGGGRGWLHSPQNQYRPNFPREGGPRGPPYFNRGGGVGGPRGHRGKFRGNAWI